MSSNEACYGFVFARRGLVPEAASSWFLPRIVGISRALEWCYSGRLLSAQEALAGNLVSAIYPPADLLPAATAMAISIAQHAAPISVALTRQLMWRGLSMNDPMEAHRIESRAIFARAHSDDLQEGIRAHVERRSPRFTGAVSNGMPEFFPWWEPLEYR
jgi:enoyl-CoA hydratase/carnithine racemase